MSTHHTLIDGTAYAISGGSALKDGTKYQIGGGTTLVDGTQRSIEFAEKITLTLLKKCTYNGIGGTATLEYKGRIYDLIGSGSEIITIRAGETVTLEAGGMSTNVRGDIRLNNSGGENVGEWDNSGTKTYIYTPTDGDKIEGDRIYKYQSSSNKGGAGLIVIYQS